MIKLGYKVKLLPAKHVKGYVRGNKNDYNDALAIAEASRVPQIRAVISKTFDQQSMQALHSLRDKTIGERTALSNQLRGLLAEFGIISPQGLSKTRNGLCSVLEDAENDLIHTLRATLTLKHSQFTQQDELISELNQLINVVGNEQDQVGLLLIILGYGGIVSTAFYSVVGDGKAFAKSRDASASVGVFPRQYSSGKTSYHSAEAKTTKERSDDDP